MTTFTTRINSIYTLPTVNEQTNVVVTVMYAVTAVNGDHTAEINAGLQIALEEGAAFVPFDQLTEAQVIAWIPESMIESAQACVQGQIDSMITPPVSPTSQPLPWGVSA